MKAIAREDKGILGKDWNKSDKTYFRTTSYNPTVAPTKEEKSRENNFNKNDNSYTSPQFNPKVSFL